MNRPPMTDLCWKPTFAEVTVSYQSVIGTRVGIEL